ncbi:hypothetical protein ILYODFUR_034665 [Ilyodon furcidens]|uniref:Secreted protein n=1 Tax=Ilyodon furcidens TaxID=33524 RepID=A0ABV0ULH7_9TELE
MFVFTLPINLVLLQLVGTLFFFHYLTDKNQAASRSLTEFSYLLIARGPSGNTSNPTPCALSYTHTTHMHQAANVLMLSCLQLRDTWGTMSGHHYLNSLSH